MRSTQLTSFLTSGNQSQLSYVSEKYAEPQKTHDDQKQVPPEFPSKQDGIAIVRNKVGAVDHLPVHRQLPGRVPVTDRHRVEVDYREAEGPEEHVNYQLLHLEVVAHAL